MHEILLCLKFKAVVDVIRKSFLVCLITWMVKFFRIKYYDVDTHGAFDSGSVYFISGCQGLELVVGLRSWRFLKSRMVLKI